MVRLNIFDDGRKMPKLSVNLKVKIKSRNQDELANWNTFFGYLMKKQRTKLDFLAVAPIRELDLSKIKLDSIKDYINEEDYDQISKIEKIFDKKLTSDVKSFILAMLRIPLESIKSLIK